MTVTNLEDQLKRDEGQVLHVYLDTKGIRTAGVGHNLEAHGIDWPVGTPITQDQSDQWLAEDITAATSLLESHLPWAAGLDDARRGVLLNMMFNMGWGDGHHGLSSFKHTLALFQSGQYDAAADGMASSGWASQVGVRAVRLEEQTRTGVWQ